MKQSKKTTAEEPIVLSSSGGTLPDTGAPTDGNNVPVPVLKVQMTKPSDLKYHPENLKYYGEPKANERLLENIKTLGIQQPIVANTDGTVFQGHNRLFIAKELKIPEVPVIRVDVPDHIDQLEWILSGNVQRDKTNEQRAREFEGYKEIEAARAKKRQATNAKEGGSTEALHGRKQETSAKHVKNSAQAEAGKSRNIAAEMVGWSGPTAENAAAVVKVIDDLKAKDPASATAEDLVAKLNDSVHSAFLECRRKGLILTNSKAKSGEGGINEKFVPPGRTYASRQFNPFAEDGTIDQKQLALLKLTSPPDSGDDRILKSLVALPMDFDLLAKEVADEAIAAFNAELKGASQWKCLVETRNFERAAKITWPDNAWVGMVVSTQAEIDGALSAADKVQGGMVWLHCRIDSEGLSIKTLDDFSWVVISLANEDVDWVDVDPVFRLARREKVPVFFDSSVKCRPHELPKVKTSTSKPLATPA